MRALPAQLATLMLCVAAPVAAGNLTVAPTRIDLEAGRTSGAVTLQNNGAEPVLVQVETFAWPRSPATGDLEPTRGLVAVPAVFSLAPDGKQIIRVALRQAQQGDSEQAYRLLITEVPESHNKGGVQFVLRLSLPVFATPQGAVPSPHWSISRDAAKPTLQLVNSGKAHLQVQKIRLKHSDGTEQTIDEPSYVLAGQQRAWDLRLPMRSSAIVALEADTNIGTLAFPLTAGGG